MGKPVPEEVNRLDEPVGAPVFLKTGHVSHDEGVFRESERGAHVPVWAMKIGTVEVEGGIGNDHAVQGEPESLA